PWGMHVSIKSSKSALSVAQANTQRVEKGTHLVFRLFRRHERKSFQSLKVCEKVERQFLVKTPRNPTFFKRLAYLIDICILQLTALSVVKFRVLTNRPSSLPLRTKIRVFLQRLKSGKWIFRRIWSYCPPVIRETGNTIMAKGLWDLVERSS